MTKDKKTLNNMSEINIEDIVKEEYRTYQLYTLMDRALPYLVDGLKPSQRRILYTLFKNKSKGLLKVSSATGLVLTLHPHGPQSVESSIVNMAQDYTFTNNYPLIDKKGYFGERMETQAAASRYIECKLSKLAEIILFDDLNQVNMIPNYDERTVEPEFLLPKLPLMLLNGAEGIATGYSCVIPSFHHKDIIDLMISIIKKEKRKKLKPWVNHYNSKIMYDKDRNKYIFNLQLEEVKEKGLRKFYITELPKGYDAKKINKHLSKLQEEGIIKDYVDSTVNNDIKIEIVMKKGTKISLQELYNQIAVSSTMTPNYTLVSEYGVEIFTNPEDIVEIFTKERLKVIKKRYELLVRDTENELTKNNEIIRFIKEKHYAKAEKRKNRVDYIKYLKSKKFKNKEYLADLPIYRMTKEEVAKRQLLVKENKIKLKEYKSIFKSQKKIKGKLIEELLGLKELLSQSLRKK